MPVPCLVTSGEERRRLAERRLGQLVFGKWRLERLLGVGGMASVFEAVHRNGSRVAIKILHPDLAHCPDARAQFLTESYAANRVSHAGVVTVRDEGTTEDGAVFLVMDLLQGMTLAERLERPGPQLSVPDVLEIASQLLDVLAHAHARGIIHRDIKPENIFLTHEGRVRLLDFGVARVESAAHSHASPPGTTLGTPAFMAPEQAAGHWEELDGRSDLWSLGATLYLALSGRPVRERGSVTEQLLGAMLRPVPSLGEESSLPRSVVAVVDRALAFDREQRFPDARSMQLAVRAALDELATARFRRAPAPPSLEPMALSVRRASGRSAGASGRGAGASARAQVPTTRSLRPVAAHVAPARHRERASKSALPLHITLGVVVGLGIVVVTRLNIRTAEPPVILPEHAAAPLAAAPASASADAPAPATSASRKAATSGAPRYTK